MFEGNSGVTITTGMYADELEVNSCLLVRCPTGIGGLSYAETRIIGNTFAFNTTAVGAYGWTTLYGNVFARNERGVFVSGGTTNTIDCNLFWGNVDSDVRGQKDPSDTDWNIHSDPLFCDPARGDFHVRSDSPCLPDNNPCGIRIGAFGAGCGPVSIESESWGKIKSLYR